MDKESRRKNGKDVRTITGFTSKNNEKVDGIKKVKLNSFVKINEKNIIYYVSESGQINHVFGEHPFPPIANSDDLVKHYEISTVSKEEIKILLISVLIILENL